jgi:hypothetical protein
MKDFKIHLFVAGGSNRRFLQYATMAVDTLLQNGNVTVEDIILSIGAEFMGDTPIAMFKRIGITVLPIYAEQAWFTKLYAVNKLFKFYPNVKTILQYDVDIFLNVPIDINNLINDYRSYDCAVYADFGCSAKTCYLARRALYLYTYSIIPNDQKSIRAFDRYEAFLKSNYGLSYAQFICYLEANHWVHGGMSIYNRSITSTEAWVKLQKYSWISLCDETALLITKASVPNFSLCMIDPIRYPHIVGFKLGQPVSFTKCKGFLHYASEKYRNNPENKQYLEEQWKISEKNLLNFKRV